MSEKRSEKLVQTLLSRLPFVAASEAVLLRTNSFPVELSVFVPASGSSLRISSSGMLCGLDNEVSVSEKPCLVDGFTI